MSGWPSLAVQRSLVHCQSLDEDALARYWRLVRRRPHAVVAGLLTRHPPVLEECVPNTNKA